MSSSRVDGILPLLAEFGGTQVDTDAGVVSGPVPPKIKLIGPSAANKRVSRGLTGAIQRPSERVGLNTDNGDHLPHHHNPQTLDNMMTISRKPRAGDLRLPILNAEDLGDVFDEEMRMGTPSTCETPIPPLPRARVPSKLGSISTDRPDPPEPGELAARSMVLIGRPASRASFNRFNVTHLEGYQRRKESSAGSIPSTPLLRDEGARYSPITIVEEELKHLLLCQSMGVKIVTSTKDFVPGIVAQLVFHCPRCLKHWKMSGKPQAPGECQEPDEPTQGPEFTITITKKNHQIIQQMDKLPTDDKHHLMQVLSEPGSPGADEELLELINSASSDFLRQSSASPHASRRSRSLEKRSIARLTRDKRDQDAARRSASGSPRSIECVRQRDSGLKATASSLVDHKRWKSADRDRDSGYASPRYGAVSTLPKCSPAEKTNVDVVESPKTSVVTQPVDGDISDLKNETPLEGAIENELNQGVNKEQLVKTIETSERRSELYIPSEKKTKQHEQFEHHPRVRPIPKGERTATGQSMLEFQDIDGAKYHGVLSLTGQFMPVARLDASGNRHPVAMKPDGGYCIVGKDGERSFSSMNVRPSGSVDELVDIRDSTGATLGGHRKSGGQFVPIVRIDEGGNKQAVMVKSDGRYYVEHDNNVTSDGSKVEQFVVFSNDTDDSLNEESFGVIDVQVKKHDVEMNDSTLSSLRHDDSEQEDAVIKIDGHDGKKYQGFNLPGLGFVPKARIENDDSRRPIVMNNEGIYSVVSPSGVLEKLNLDYFQEDYLESHLECRSSEVVTINRSKSPPVIKRRSSSSCSFPGEDQLKISTNEKPVQHPQTDRDITHDDHLIGNKEQLKPGREINPSEDNQTLFLRHGPDGTMYLGRCYSDNFEPVFRVDEKGNRYPIRQSSLGKNYIIESGYFKDEKGDTDSKIRNERSLTRLSYNGYMFEGYYTIDGRFIPVARVDDEGNRQHVTLSKVGNYMFMGKQGKMTYVDFNNIERKLPMVNGVYVTGNRASTRGDDGHVYEGYETSDGDIVPTYRVESGFRRMVLRNLNDHCYVIGAEGEIENVPPTVSSKVQKKTKSGQRSGNSAMKEDSLKPKDRQIHSSDILNTNDTSLDAAIGQPSPMCDVVTGTGDQDDDRDMDARSGGIGEGYSNDGRGGDDLQTTSKLDSVRDEHSSTPSQVITSEVKAVHDVAMETSNESLNLDGNTNGDSHMADSEDVFKKIGVVKSSTHSESQNRSKTITKECNKTYNGIMDKGVQAPKITLEGIKNSASNLERSNKIEQSDVTARDKTTLPNVRERENATGGSQKVIIKNTAVHNVTGRPDTKAGQFKKHVFATPQADLADSEGLGAVTKDNKGGETWMTDSSPEFRPKVMTTGGTHLPSLSEPKTVPDKSLLEGVSSQDVEQRKRDVLPPIGHDSTGSAASTSQNGTVLHQVEQSQRGSKPERVIKMKEASKNRKRPGQLSIGAEISQEHEITVSNERVNADRSKEQVLPPADLRTKFPLSTAEPTFQVPPLEAPPSDSQPSYRMTYSTLPGRLRSPKLNTMERFSSEHSKSPDASLFQKRPSAIEVTNLPETCKEFVIPCAKVSSGISHKSSMMSTLRRTSTRLFRDRESFPPSISIIWKQHQMEVEAMRLSFQLSLTRSFSFSYFELPQEYEERNALLLRMARQIRTMKNPTKLAKPRKIQGTKPTLVQKKVPNPHVGKGARDKK